MRAGVADTLRKDAQVRVLLDSIYETLKPCSSVLDRFKGETSMTYLAHTTGVWAHTATPNGKS